MTRFLLLYDNIICIQLPDALELQNSPILTILNLRSKSARFSEHPINKRLSHSVNFRNYFPRINQIPLRKLFLKFEPNRTTFYYIQKSCYLSLITEWLTYTHFSYICMIFVILVIEAERHWREETAWKYKKSRGGPSHEPAHFGSAEPVFDGLIWLEPKRVSKIE